jgi:hypothetical protein
MHQLNVRVDDDLFRDLRMAYAREIERRATLRELARTASGVTFEDRGEQPLKGSRTPYACLRRWQE